MDMEMKMLIALILGGSGVALALLGLIIAIVANMTASRALRESEEFQQEQSRKESASWMKTQELKEKLKIRSHLHKRLGSLKVQLEYIIHAEPGALDSRAIEQSISESGRNFCKACDEHASTLTNSEQEAMDRARAAATSITAHVKSVLASLSDPSALPSKDRETLLRLRQELTESQLTLHDQITDRLIKRLVSEGEG